MSVVFLLASQQCLDDTGVAKLPGISECGHQCRRI